MLQLTDREIAILKFVEIHVSATNEEIATTLGYSENSVKNTIANLKRYGKLHAVYNNKKRKERILRVCSF